MKILILGSTGRLGNRLFNEALERGHQLNVLVRDSSEITLNNNVTVFTGLPTDMQMLEKSMSNCDVLVSALNISRTSDFPLAPLRTPKDFLSNTAQNIIDLVPKSVIKRVIIVSAQGVNETRGEIPTWFRWAIDHTNIRYAYQEHERQENLIRSSNLVWTIVRPVGLTNQTISKIINVSQGNIPKPSLTISRSDVAKFVLDEAENARYIKRAVTISSN